LDWKRKIAAVTLSLYHRMSLLHDPLDHAMQVAAIIAAGLATLIFSTSDASAGQAFKLEVLDSLPLLVDPSIEPFGLTTAGLILNATSTPPDGRITFLAGRIKSGTRSQVLIREGGQNRLGDEVPLNLKGVQPAGNFLSRIFNKPAQIPFVSALAVGRAGETWLGGYTNAFIDIASSRHSDAYLAKVDATGNPSWEAYANQGAISSIATLAAGDVAVFGPGQSGGRVARIDPAGNSLWERPLGNDLGGMVASLPGDRLAVVGFEATETGQHVTTFILDGEGNQLARIRIRDSISKSQNSYFGKVSLVVSEDAIYVASNWTGLFDAQPVAIAKISMAGQLLWSTLLPDTIAEVKTSVRSWKGCSPAFGITPQGGVLAACALNDEIQLYNLTSFPVHTREAPFPCRIARSAIPPACLCRPVEMGRQH
jgi:hypothetical protein